MNTVITSPEMHINFFALFILVIPLLLIPGAILGWVAAGRIRQSDGQLYGLRLAVIAALPLPALLVLIVPLLVSALIIRIGQFTSLGTDNATLIGIATAVSLLIFSFKLLHACYLELSGKEDIREVFRLNKMRSIFIVLAVLWCAAGTIMLLQRPKQIGSPVTSTSPDGMLTASVGIWKRMNLFGPDKLSYRYRILSHQGEVLTNHENPIPREFAETHSTSNPHEILKIEEYGRIIWDTEKSAVSFKVNDTTLYLERLPIITAERAEQE